MQNSLSSGSFMETRRRMVELIKRRGISDELLLEAMNKLPRELFVDSEYKNRAYDDSALPIDCEQTISQPYTVAYMTELLKVMPDSKILEIGTGSGYQSCLLYLMGAEVHTIERIYELYKNSGKLFQELKMNIHTYLGDGSIGLTEKAPFSGIIVTAAAPEVPKSLLEQLVIGGRLVVPVGDKYTQSMYLVVREGKRKFKETTSDRFKFVPLIGKEGW